MVCKGGAQIFLLGIPFKLVENYSLHKMLAVMVYLFKSILILAQITLKFKTLCNACAPVEVDQHKQMLLRYSEALANRSTTGPRFPQLAGKTHF